jgi:hypothetical protein
MIVCNRLCAECCRLEDPLAYRSAQELKDSGSFSDATVDMTVGRSFESYSQYFPICSKQSGHKKVPSFSTTRKLGLFILRI